MEYDSSFRFLDSAINEKFIGAIKKFDVMHVIDEEGNVHYSSKDEEVVENELLGAVRRSVFPSWQILSFPQEWTAIYKTYLDRHRVPYVEELMDDRLGFLIPRKYRPHAWKLEPPNHDGARSGSSEGRRPRTPISANST